LTHWSKWIDSKLSLYITLEIQFQIFVYGKHDFFWCAWTASSKKKVTHYAITFDSYFQMPWNLVHIKDIPCLTFYENFNLKYPNLQSQEPTQNFYVSSKCMLFIYGLNHSSREIIFRTITLFLFKQCLTSMRYSYVDLLSMLCLICTFSPLILREFSYFNEYSV